MVPFGVDPFSSARTHTRSPSVHHRPVTGVRHSCISLESDFRPGYYGVRGSGVLSSDRKVVRIPTVVPLSTLVVFPSGLVGVWESRGYPQLFPFCGDPWGPFLHPSSFVLFTSRKVGSSTSK